MEEGKKKSKGAPPPRKHKRSPTINRRRDRDARHQAWLKRGTAKRAAARVMHRLTSRMTRDGYHDAVEWSKHRTSLRHA